jgi:RNA polymerase sigma-70 factor (ECF subfamily)
MTAADLPGPAPAPPAWVARCADLLPAEGLAAMVAQRAAAATSRQRAGLWLDVASERLVILAQTTGAQQTRAAELLIALWAVEVLRWCRWLAGPALDPDDLAQDVLVCALERIGQVREPALFRHWLHGLCWRRVLGETRRAWFRRRDPAPPRDDAADSTEPTAEVARARQARQVQAVLDALLPEHRRLLGLHYVEEFSRAEIASLTGLPPGTLNRRLTEARRAFEACAIAHGLATDASVPDPPRSP